MKQKVKRYLQMVSSYKRNRHAIFDSYEQQVFCIKNQVMRGNELA